MHDFAVACVFCLVVVLIVVGVVVSATARTLPKDSAGRDELDDLETLWHLDGPRDRRPFE